MTSSVKEMPDIDLVLMYQACNNDKYFNELVTRYTPLIKANATYLNKNFYEELTYSEAYSDSLMAFYRAVRKFDIRRIRDPKEFKIKVLVHSEIQRICSLYMKKLQTKKRGFVNDNGKKVYNQRQVLPLIDSVYHEMPVTRSLLDKYLENEFVHEFCSQLTGREQAVLYVLYGMEKPIFTKAVTKAGFSRRSGIAKSMKKKFLKLTKAG